MIRRMFILFTLAAVHRVDWGWGQCGGKVTAALFQGQTTVAMEMDRSGQIRGIFWWWDKQTLLMDWIFFWNLCEITRALFSGRICINPALWKYREIGSKNFTAANSHPSFTLDFVLWGVVSMEHFVYTEEGGDGTRKQVTFLQRFCDSSRKVL